MARKPKSSWISQDGEYMTVRQVTELFNVSDSVVYRLLDENKLPFLEVTPTCIRIKRADVLAYIESRTVQAGN
jgi:excisionase family DNA binding protein